MHTEISLEGLEFFAYHGFYPEEQRKGNTFSVDVKVICDLVPADASDLEKTVNYEQIFAIVEKEMQHTAALLETVAARILDEIFVQFKHIGQAEVAVSKFNPPIKGKCERARVMMKRSR